MGQPNKNIPGRVFSSFCSFTVFKNDSEEQNKRLSVKVGGAASVERKEDAGSGGRGKDGKQAIWMIGWKERETDRERAIERERERKGEKRLSEWED